jgi:hypothetical protein
VAAGPEERGIHEVRPLVVGDEGDADALPGEVLAEGAEGGGLAGAEEAAEEDEVGRRGHGETRGRTIVEGAA